MYLIIRKVYLEKLNGGVVLRWQNTYLEDVSITVTGTRSGNISSDNQVGGNTGETFARKASVTTVIIKLDLPVPRLLATTIRISVVEINLAAYTPPTIGTINVLQELPNQVREKVAGKSAQDVLGRLVLDM
ncbi:hypothetical protein L2E82_41718 [Cichorium intybus]|uniref:Uncharacterized protein n=1 Tax=Cichorium intybus TaxID=13427 RepID=A0ACB8ZL29_CICIN|nr:hypothetical protein L2E82_41718 [Cichorium intybus]